MDTSKLPAWPTKDDPLSAFLNRHSWLIVLIFAPLFVVTYFPANYAIPFPIWDKWWWAIRYVGYVSIALQILRHRNLVPWLTSFLLLFLYFGLSSRLTDQTPDWGTGNFHVIMDLGFVSLTAYVFSLKKEPALLAYIIPGIIMSCVNFYTFFVFKDVPGGMAAGITAYDQTQSWFFFTHDNGSFFITFPTVVLVLYYGLQVRKSLRYVAIGYAGVVAAIYTWMFSVAAMFGYGLLFIAAVVALVLQRDPKRRFSSNLYPICIAVGLVICLLMVLANTNDILASSPSWASRTPFRCARLSGVACSSSSPSTRSPALAFWVPTRTSPTSPSATATTSCCSSSTRAASWLLRRHCSTCFRSGSAAGRSAPR